MALPDRAALRASQRGGTAGGEAAARAAALQRVYGRRDTPALLDAMIGREFPGRIALVSSFGAESIVLLHLAASVRPDVPVVFIDTGKLFGATHRYREEVVARLGLTDIRIARPDPAQLSLQDPSGDLWMREPGACCGVRKVAPLARVIGRFDAWISGRKRFQGATRAAIPLFEADGPRIKINPLAHWTKEELASYLRTHGLPEHPLTGDGYRSIGCLPCTDRVGEGEDERSGRWRGRDKTECGIHLGLPALEEDGSGI